jgi:hypothetical protein
MLDIDKLIGKYIYTHPVKLISNELDTYQIPVIVKTAVFSSNVAGVVINGSIIIGYDWVEKLIESLNKKEA